MRVFHAIEREVRCGEGEGERTECSPKRLRIVPLVFH